MYTHFARSYGTNAYLIDNPISTGYTKVQNDVGMATITVLADHPAVAGLALDDQVEIWRGNTHPATGVKPYMDFRGLYRGYSLRTLSNGLGVADLFLFHENEVLRRAIVAYPSGLSGTTAFSATAATTVMQFVLLDNFTSKTVSIAGATRIVQATSKTLAMGAITVPGSLASDYDCSGRNVLAVWQELAQVDNSVFVITKSTSTSTTWLAYINRDTFATDRRDTVIFEVIKENIAELELDLRTVGETTVAIVAGQGSGASRPFRSRYSGGYDAATNHHESWIDGRNQNTNDALDAYGDAAINRSQALPSVRFLPVNLPSFNYGQDYFWGDIVTLRHEGQDYIQRIAEVSVAYSASDAGERVRIRFEDLP